MAVYTHVSASPSNTPLQDLGWSTVLNADSTTIDILLSDGTVLRIIGTGFTYDPGTGQPVGGTVTSVWHSSSDLSTVYEQFIDVSASLPALVSGTIADFFNQLMSGNDALNGFSGNDILLGGPEGDALYGGDGFDLADYVTATSGVVASLADPSVNTGHAAGDTYNSIEGIWGSAFDDTLIGDGNRNELYGWDGNDLLDGGPGSPDDVVNPFAGDTMFGGTGNDTYIVDALYDAAIEFVGEGIDTVLTTISYSLPLFSEVENITFIGVGDFTSFGNALDNVMIGGAGNDLLFGDNGGDPLLEGGDDTFVGGGGNDVLWGDTGSDTAVYSGNSTDYWFAGTTEHFMVTDGVGGDGTDVLHWVDFLQFADGTFAVSDFLDPPTPGGSAPNDFDGNGMSDILWYNSASGQVAIWHMNGAQIDSSQGVGAVGGAWQIASVAEFNKDYGDDILWYNSESGQVTLWQMNGSQVISSQGIGVVSGAWQIAGVGEFTPDTKSDILWYNPDNGQVTLWEMNGAQIVSSKGVATVGGAWQIAGTADFDGDFMTDDILWYNPSNGQVTIWQMQGTQITASLGVGVVGGAWQIAGTGDFNGDGKSDILWHNTSNGQVTIWQMNGVLLTSSQGVGVVGGAWQIAGTDDYNGDGNSDILWHNSSNGQVTLWQMNGAQIVSSQGIGVVSGGWVIA
jgi:Ca2+-binding RTX toxin-like protein